MGATALLPRAERIGRKIRVRRVELGLSQNELADKLGISQSSLSAWERGIYEPSGANVLLLARVLKIKTARGDTSMRLRA